MSVHYKFKSALEYDTVTFDGLHISVKDLKNAIIQQKRIGKNTDFDLQVTNAQTKEVYDDAETLIPKNTSLLIARIPLAAQKQKTWEGYGGDSTPPARADEGGPIAKAVDLSSLDASEDDKIRAMISQSTQDYDPSNYVKIRGANQVGAVPPNYRCYKCHQMGHWIKDCPLSQGPEPMEIKKSTGIPRSFMIPVDGPQVPGAMMTPNGSYAVPVLDHQTYTQQKMPQVPIHEEKPEIPEDLLCSICTDLLADAVMIPCCGNSFCDECIRSCLLESEDHECPDCHERDISPGTLIPNRFLRNSVSNFKSTTGYVKRPVYKPSPTPIEKDPPKVPPEEVETEKDQAKEVEEDKPEKETPKPLSKDNSKPIISEADSTESTNKVPTNTTDDANTKKKQVDINIIPEGPPGVSPSRDPPQDTKKKIPQVVQEPLKSTKSSECKPQAPKPRSPAYTESFSRTEERPGTPTVDEPGMGNGSSMNTNNVYPPATAPYPSGPPPGILPPMMSNLGPPPHMQGPPPSIPTTYSTSQPPPGVFPNPAPNYRMPPPGAAPPYMPGPYNVPPRPMFDPTRPPMPGAMQNYGNFRGPRGREFPPRPMRGRTPPGIIDDPLEAFNRMLREKDERERRAKQRKGRSYSRSSSRSYSRSPRRHRSRTPRRRQSRSRSRSFSMSRENYYRSRSRSYSPNRSPYRDYSPRNTSPRRRQASRYRSPVRSPPRYRFKEAHVPERNRERNFERERDFPRDNRGFSRDRDREYRDTHDHNDYYYDNYDRGRPKHQWNNNHSRGPPQAQQESYYSSEIHQPSVYPSSSNRYPQRDAYPPYMNKNEPPPQHHMQQQQQPIHTSHPPPRRFDDVAPPGTDQPPIPGEESSPRYDDNRYGYDRLEQPKDRYNAMEQDINREQERNYNERSHEDMRERKHERKSRSPSRNARNPSPKLNVTRKERHESPDRHKRKKREGSSDKKEIERDKYNKKEVSDDEKIKKSRDKKKKKEKKEGDKKKRKDRKSREEKHKRKSEEKDKKEKNKLKEESTEVTNDDTEKDKIKDVEISMEEAHLLPKEDELSEPRSRIDSLRDENSRDDDHERFRNKDRPDEPAQTLYDDINPENVDNDIVKTYGKLDVTEESKKLDDIFDKNSNEKFEEDASKEYEDVLDIHTNESELIKPDADLKPEFLAPLPEKSKWEMEDEPLNVPIESKYDAKNDKTGKVTNEVLKRAENAIFAKAINAIRPIEIKKISVDRAKLYSGEREKKEEEVRNLQVTIKGQEEVLQSAVTDPPKTETVEQPSKRIPVKERLGCKVDDLDRIVKVDRRSRSKSTGRRNYERRVEVDDRRDKRDRERHDRDNRYHRGGYRNDNRRDVRRDTKDRRDFRRDDRRDYRRDDRYKRDPLSSYIRPDDDKLEKRKRSTSNSEERKHKRKEKKVRKDKIKKRNDENSEKDTPADKEENKPKVTTEKRKTTLDEANFEPDYDLDSESEKDDKENSKTITPLEIDVKKPKLEEQPKESSSSDSSSTSSDDEKKKKKHKKHRKKKSKKDSSSSSSDSDSDSSEEEQKKRKKHKKKSKKRKKSKHK